MQSAWNPSAAPRPAPSDPQAPTHVRHWVVGVTTLTSFLLYLDRACLGEIVIADSFQADLGFTKDQRDTILSAFFFAYALFQVPSGWLSDRFGARGMMALYVAGWSLFTALTGLGTGLLSMAIWRAGCGLAQAGAYPTSSGLLSRWVTYQTRGVASSIVAFGGRIGFALAPKLTVLLIAVTGSWRPVLWLYGGVGLGVAWMFWFVFRNRPEDHPRVNRAEHLLIEHSRPADVPSPHGRASRLPLSHLLASRSMWLNSTSQFFTNVGWAFLITNMPEYLKTAQHVGDAERGTMGTVALLVGMAGMLFGGRLTDAMTRRLGIRWGRSLPVALSRFVAAAAYFMCLGLEQPWFIVAAFAVVAFATDVGGPAAWAFAQDAGGKHVGSVLGWGNMWGNFGAALCPKVVGWILAAYDTNGDWHEVFIALGISFVLSGLAALGMDASIPIVPEERPD